MGYTARRDCEWSEGWQSVELKMGKWLCLVWMGPVKSQGPAPKERWMRKGRKRTGGKTCGKDTAWAWLALTVAEGAVSSRVQVAFRCYRKQTGASPQASRKEHKLANFLILPQWEELQMLEFQNCKTVHLSCRTLHLWQLVVVAIELEDKMN